MRLGKKGAGEVSRGTDPQPRVIAWHPCRSESRQPLHNPAGVPAWSAHPPQKRFLKQHSSEFHEILKLDGRAAHPIRVRSRTTRNAVMRSSRNWVVFHCPQKWFEFSGILEAATDA